MSELPRLLRSAPRAVLVEGDARASLRRAGYRAKAFVALPEASRVRVVVTPEHGLAASYGITTRVQPASTLKRLRRDAAAGLLRRGIVPPFLPLLTTGYREDGAPFLVAAAERELGEQALGWFFVTGSGDALSRNVYFLFRAGARSPEWVLKFTRVPNYDLPFRVEEAAWLEARDVGPVLTSRVPQPTARFDVGGRAAAIETAGPGRRLDAILSAAGAEADKMAAVERVLAWLLELASASRAPRERVVGEWRRLQELARPAGVPLPQDAFFDPVLQHNDLGGWNVIADGARFTVVDWEFSRRYSAPLCDVWYFLVHVLPVLAGVDPLAREDYVRRLLRGEERWSELLFRWTLRAADEAGIARAELGLLATLCWLDHASTKPRAALAVHAPGATPPELLVARMPGIWLGDDGLGVAWRSLTG